MGTNFNELWNDPAFIDPPQKAKIEADVASIGKQIEDRESVVKLADAINKITE